MDPALKAAIESDNLEAFNAALENGAKPNQGDENYTPLTRLAEETPEKNGLKMIELLLKAGANANLKDSSDDPKIPLEYAVLQLRMFKTHKGHEEDVKRAGEVIGLLYPATNDANIAAVQRDYNGVIPSEIGSTRKPAPIPNGAGKRKHKKKTNKRRKTTKRRRTLKRF